MKIEKIEFLTADQQSKLIAAGHDRINSKTVITILQQFLQGEKAHTVRVTGSKRWTNNADYSIIIIPILKILGIDYTIGNDAPRKGAHGNYILMKDR